MQNSKNKVKALTFSSIGKSAPKIEGVQKVSGQARYTADYLLPGTIWGKVLRSPYPHARIVRMDTSRAKAPPGVMAVLTAADIPNVLTRRRLRDIPMLGGGRARTCREKVAIAAGEDRYLSVHCE